MLLTTVLASAVAIAAGAVAEAARVQVTSSVDAHWRGSYDILVRPPGSRLLLEKTAGVVEPNFLGFTGIGGITLDQLIAIRGLTGVELAAPVAFIGYVTIDAAVPTIHITAWPTKLTLYQADLTVATSDGLGQRLLLQQRIRVLLAPPAKAGDPPVVETDYGNSSVSGYPDGSWDIDLSGGRFLPGIMSPVLAVDPVAEGLLLGGAGTSLAPLADLSGQQFTAGTFDAAAMADTFWETRMRISRLADRSATAGRPVFPVLVADSVGRLLTLTLDVGRVGAPIDAPLELTGALEETLSGAANLAGPGLTPVGRSTTDISREWVPFASAHLTVSWPGSVAAPVGVGRFSATEFRPALSDRPAYAPAQVPADISGPAFRIEPAGVVDVGGVSIGAGHTTLRTGTEQTYRTLRPADNPLVRNFTPANGRDAPFVFAPVGTFDMASLTPPTDPLTYVPLGAYDPPDTRYVADAAGTRVTPQVMTPTVNPAGLLQVPPLALADVSAAVAFRGSAPLDAIRVRVAGLTGFDEEGKAKVEEVATRISAMGLDVDIVAGSSPQTVNVYVPAYDTSVDPPADLGWVQQPWTTLGAATRVVRGLGDTNAALLALAMLALLVVITGLEVLFAASRRRDAALLAAVGWSRWARVRWQVSEALTAGILVTVVGLMAWGTLGRTPAALGAVILIGAAFPLAGLAAALATPVSAGAAVSAGRGGGLLRRIPVDGLTAFSLRSLAARPVRTLFTILALGVAAATTGPALALVATVGLRVGPTRLADAIGVQLAPYQAALLALAAAGSVAFCLVALRSSVADREEEMRSLVATGWLPADMRGLLWRERAIIALPAALLSGSLAWVAAGPITGATPAASAAVAAGLALSVVVWGGLVAHPAALGQARTSGRTPPPRRGSGDHLGDTR